MHVCMVTTYSRVWINRVRYFVDRNRKRFLLSQSTLREEFAEKKYQGFDIVSLLIIPVQVNLSSPVERV